MTILLVEDDYLQSDLIISQITLALDDVEFILLETEFQLRSYIPKLENNPSDIILLDIMLRWTDPAPDMPSTPDDVLEEGFYTAGLRCQKIISDNIKLKNIPIVLYSVLDKFDLEGKLKDSPKNVTHVSKDKDIPFLIDHIKRVLQIRDN